MVKPPPKLPPRHSSVANLFGGKSPQEQQQQKQEQIRKKKLSTLKSVTCKNISDAFEIVLHELDFLGLQEEGTTFRHITDERDKLDFIQDVGYDFLENKLYFPKNQKVQKEPKEQKEPIRFELDNPFYIRKIHDFILNIWKEVQESYVNFLCETEGLIERMQEGIYEYLMRFFPYAWDNYYDVGPWTVTTFFKLTKSDKIECREQILLNMNELLNKLYFPKEEMSKDLIKNIVLQLSILQKIFHNIPLVPTIIIKDREGEGAQMIEEVDLQGGGSAQGGGNVVGGYGGRRRRTKRKSFK